MPTVAPELVVWVRRAATQIGYRPNLTAPNHRRLDGKTLTIGLLLQDLANPFSATLHRAIEDVARGRRTIVLAGSLDEDPDRERELTFALIDRRVDGLIMVPAGSDHSYLVDEQRAGTAVVFLDRRPVLLAADAVVSDNREGAAGGVRHLIEAGHRRIAYLGDHESIETVRERHRGYEQALKEAGLPVDPSIVRLDLRSVSAAEDAAAAMLALADPPSAFFTGQNLVTIGAIQALHNAQTQHRVALVGFDDFSLAGLVEPAITVVAQDVAAMGKLAAELLFKRIDGDRSPFGTNVMTTRLVARGSGEILPTL